MPHDLFVPLPDAVNGELFIETKQTRVATTALFALLAVSRTEEWLPTTVLCGEHGAGTSTVARRFVKAAQRNVACDAVAESLGYPAPGEALTGAKAEALVAEWAERMARGHGTDCPGFCTPAAWIPEATLSSALEYAQMEHPVVELTMDATGPLRDLWMISNQLHTPGNEVHHPTRRTTLLMIDQADRILQLSSGRRRALLDGLETSYKRIGHAVGLVLVGTPPLEEAIAEHRTTQVIRVDALPNDAAFATTCGLIFNTKDPAEIDALHRQTRGLMGRLIHVARMRGLKPPYRIDPDEISSLLPAASMPT